jgi:hypothetical protein
LNTKGTDRSSTGALDKHTAPIELSAPPTSYYSKASITFYQIKREDDSLEMFISFDPVAVDLEGFDPVDPPPTHAMIQVLHSYIQDVVRLAGEIKMDKSSTVPSPTKSKQ